MTKIWSVEEGEYSSYGIVAVFSTRENAEIALAFYNKGKDVSYRQAWIEERELDPSIENIRAGLLLYCVSFFAKSGVRSSLRTEHIENDSLDSHGKYGSNYYVWSKDELSAVKIAAERHAQWRATQAGIT